MATPQWQIDADSLNNSLKMPDAPQANTGLIGAAATATPSTYDAATASAPSKAITNNATSTNWDVTAPQTVAGQVKGLIDANDPLQQQAETFAKQQMNARGGLNSSMYVGAARDAQNRAALPIAQADAATNANSAQYNATVANTTSQFNTAAQNQAIRDKFAADQQAAITNANAENSALAQNAQQTQAASQLNATQQNDMTRAQFDANNKLAMFNADTAAKQILTQADANLKTVLSMADKDTKEYLGNLDANTRSLIQTNAGAATLFSNYIQQMAQVMVSDKLDVTGKQAAIDNLKTGLKDSMAIQGAIADLDLSALLV